MKRQSDDVGPERTLAAGSAGDAGPAGAADQAAHSTVSPPSAVPAKATRSVPVWFHQAVLALDAVILAGVIVFAAWGRANLPILGFTEDRTEQITYASVRLTGAYVLIGWLLAIAALGGYSRRNIGAGSSEFSRLLRASLVTAAAIGIGCYLAKFPLSRGFFVILFVTGVPALMVGRIAVRQFVHGMHARGHWATRVLVAGTPMTIDDVAKVLARETTLGYSVVGAVTPRFWRERVTPAGHEIIGHSDDLVRLVTEHGASSVILAAGAFPRAADYRRVTWELANHDIEMIVVPALTDIASDRIRVQPLAGLPFVFVDPPERGSLDHLLKRGFDIIGAATALLLAAPLMLLAAWQVRRHDGGPVFFAQERVGQGGSTFDCLKFRSMVTDADEVLERIRHLDEGNGLLFKMEEDPRITPPGRWLRRYSVDELPQLINVLRGEMSLVGPRPPLPREVAEYQEDVHRRLNVRPGITGLWQVSGRSDLSWEDTVRLDLYYVDNWSLVQDLLILGRTVNAVVGGRGAY